MWQVFLASNLAKRLYGCARMHQCMCVRNAINTFMWMCMFIEAVAWPYDQNRTSDLTDASPRLGIGMRPDPHFHSMHGGKYG